MERHREVLSFINYYTKSGYSSGTLHLSEFECNKHDDETVDLHVIEGKSLFQPLENVII